MSNWFSGSSIDVMDHSMTWIAECNCQRMVIDNMDSGINFSENQFRYSTLGNKSLLKVE